MRDAPWRAIYRLGLRLSPLLAGRLEQAFAQAEGQIPIRDLVAILEQSGLGPDDISRLLRWLPPLLDAAARPALRRAATEAARIEVAGLGHVGLSFDLVNPRAVRVADTQAARLVTVVTAESRRAIRTIVATAIEQGITVRDTARLIRQVVGLNARQASALARFRQRLADGRVTGAALERQVDRYYRRLLRQRAELIARTEIMTAQARGQEEVWSEAMARDLIQRDEMERVWIVTPDDRLCPDCAGMDGARAPIGGVFTSPIGPVVGPPLHPHCRCAQGLVNRRRRRTDPTAAAA